MRRRMIALTLLFVVGVSGCSSAWINDPSPSTENLINDLKLEGFTCNAGFSSVVCRQKEAYVEKSAKICTGKDGCVSQPCHDVRVVYKITQASDGIPGIEQTNERSITKAIPSGTYYSAARIAELKDYCSIK